MLYTTCQEDLFVNSYKQYNYNTKSNKETYNILISRLRSDTRLTEYQSEWFCCSIDDVADIESEYGITLVRLEDRDWEEI